MNVSFLEFILYIWAFSTVICILSSYHIFFYVVEKNMITDYVVSALLTLFLCAIPVYNIRKIIEDDFQIPKFQTEG